MPETTQSVNWQALADRVLAGETVTREAALAMLQVPDTELLDLLSAAYKIRHHYFGNRVRLQVLMNAQSGLCQEDCHYCSQSAISEAEIQKYPMQSRETILAGAKRAADMGAATYCMVTSGRTPSDRHVDYMADIVREIKSTLNLKVCCCLGLLSEEQARRLKEAGVDRYNHNLNTSAEHTPNVVTTHTYQDRVDTVARVKAAGLSPCSGVIFGMGESDSDAVSVAFALRGLDADSIPVNFLNPIAGTPMAGQNDLTPRRCLKLLAMVRFINPTKEIRMAGGREVNLRTLQPLGLYPANSLFVGDYLTTPGQMPAEDHRMLTDLGFEVESQSPAAPGCC